MSCVSSSVRSCWSLACSGCVKPSCGRVASRRSMMKRRPSPSSPLRLEGSARRRGAARDWDSFPVAFKGVLLEGLEVAFIIVTFGASQGNLPLAVAAAAAAVVIVLAVGMAVRQPLTRVPENTLKFAVGVLLISFGTFWAAEGAGVEWPASDAAVLVLILAYSAVAAALVGWLRTSRV